MRITAVLGAAVFLVFSWSAPALAARHHGSRGTSASKAKVQLYKAALLEDADTGRVLYQYNADIDWPPASMAKMMLLLVAEDEIVAGHCALDDQVWVSERAAMTGGSRLGLREGEVFPLRELMKAALIKSANDAAMAVAEKIAGSAEACVRMMNQRAEKLGLTHTQYNTVDGLPPRPTHDADVTSAHDLATLGRALLKHPELLQWSGSEQALFDNEVVLRNTNHLIGHFEGCDGLKTGFTTMAGFNLTATAKRGDMRLVAVVLGAPSNAERFRQAARIMEWGFDNFERVSVVKRGEVLPVHVQVESGPLIQPIAADEVKLVVPKKDVGDIRVEYSVPPTINSPLSKDSRMGQVIVRCGGTVMATSEAVCPLAIGETANDAAGSNTDGVAAAQDGANIDRDTPAQETR